MRNAYDFDETIYDGDSSVDFYFFCLHKNKKVLLYAGQYLYTLNSYSAELLSKYKINVFVSRLRFPRKSRLEIFFGFRSRIDILLFSHSTTP